MIVFPNAKINLGLNVLRRRGDGYHDISTVFVPYKGLRDVLEIVFADEPGPDAGCEESPAKTTLTEYGLLSGCEPEKNLCYRAWKLMADKYGIGPVHIHLYKNIPSGSGLGGGSADAAFTLRLLSDLFGLGLSDEELAADAATLGSDCAFFIYNRPMLATGRGEILRDCPVCLDGYRIEVVVPTTQVRTPEGDLIEEPVHVSTAEAYSGVTPAIPAVPVEDIVCRHPEEWGGNAAVVCHRPEERKGGTAVEPLNAGPAGEPSSGVVFSEPLSGILVNDFERHILPAHPEIAAAKKAFYDRGAVYASMSGSGSSVYGIFRA